MSVVDLAKDPRTAGSLARSTTLESSGLIALTERSNRCIKRNFGELLCLPPARLRRSPVRNAIVESAWIVISQKCVRISGSFACPDSTVLGLGIPICRQASGKQGEIDMRSGISCTLSCFVAFFAILVSGNLHVDAAQADDPERPIRALLVIGGCCHDYDTQKDLLTAGISARANVQWTIAYDPDNGTEHLNPVYENQDWAKGFDVIVHDECCSDVRDLKLIDRILEPHRSGLPAVVLHCGMHCYRSEGYPDAVTPWFEFTGLQTTGHGPQLPIAIAFEKADSPIIEGLSDWTTIKEELYNNLTGELLDSAQVLARGTQMIPKKDGTEVGQECIVAWTNSYRDRTRVFATTLGHNNDTVADERYLDLVTRGLLWSVDKLEESHLKPASQVLLESIDTDKK